MSALPCTKKNSQIHAVGGSTLEIVPIKQHTGLSTKVAEHDNEEKNSCTCQEFNLGHSAYNMTVQWQKFLSFYTVNDFTTSFAVFA
jgi:hypothetical protein